MEEQLIIEIWDTFRDYIPEKTRETAANQFVDFLVGKDVDVATLEGLMGYDPHLDDALEIVLGEFKEAEDSDNDDEYDGWEEEEEDY
jgi:hypothetical protein